jgi:integrase
VETVHSVINGIFDEAVDDELIGVNPTTGLSKRLLPPKRKRNQKQPEPFTLEERKRFEVWTAEHCSLKEQMLLKMMNHAGLRLGEAIAFRLSNLDREAMKYHVRKTYRQFRFKKPKGGKFRFVDLPAYLMNDLDRYIRWLRKKYLRQGKGRQVDLLFEEPDSSGKYPLSQRKAQRLVERVCKGANLSRRNPHDLCHTYASILLMAHQSPAYVQRQLGHSGIEITVNIYCHWIPGEGRRWLGSCTGRGRFGAKSCTKFA